MQTIRKIKITKAFFSVHGLHHAIDTYAIKKYLDSNDTVVIERRDGMAFPANVYEFLEIEETDNNTTIQIHRNNPIHDEAKRI